jgi:hypothetical protein
MRGRADIDEANKILVSRNNQALISQDRQEAENSVPVFFPIPLVDVLLRAFLHLHAFKPPGVTG